MDIPVLADQQKLTFIGSLMTLIVVKRTYHARWRIGMDGERDRDRDKEKEKERAEGIHAVGIP